MLIGLLRGKLQRHLTRPSHEIEDLLTAVVLGSCQYVPEEAAVLPFIGQAMSATRERLARQLRDIEEVEYVFWPRWSKGFDTGAPAEDGEPAADVGSGSGVGWNEPEVVIKLRRSDGSWAWILVEAKLLSGKSSHASGDGAVTDQLGKYWVELGRQALASRAEPLAIVYLTTGLSFPDVEFGETQDELRRKNCAAAPLYWLSWRSFAGAVDEQAHPILRDVCNLLREHWSLAPVEPMRAWTVQPRPTTSWSFAADWCWPRLVMIRPTVATARRSAAEPPSTADTGTAASPWTFGGTRA